MMVDAEDLWKEVVDINNPNKGKLQKSKMNGVTNKEDNETVKEAKGNQTTMTLTAQEKRKKEIAKGARRMREEEVDTEGEASDEISEPETEEA